MYKFSIVIPTFEKPGLLSQTLLYLSRQKQYLDTTEIFVVDDGSTDAEANKQIVDGFRNEMHINYIYLQRSEQSCPSRTRNVGIHASSGEIIIFLDDDILVNDNFLQEHARYHDQRDDLLLTGFRRYLNKHGTALLASNILLDKEILDNYSEKDVRILLCKHFSLCFKNSGAPWEYVYSFNISIRRKNLLISNCYFDENYKKWGLEDIDFAYCCFMNGYHIVFCHRLETYHQYHGKNDYDIRSRDEITQKINDYIFEEKNGISCLEIVKQHWADAYANNRMLKIVNQKIRSEILIMRNKHKTNELKQYIIQQIMKDSDVQFIIVDEVCSDLELWCQISPICSRASVMYYPLDGIFEQYASKILNVSSINRLVF